VRETGQFRYRAAGAGDAHQGGPGGGGCLMARVEWCLRWRRSLPPVCPAFRGARSRAPARSGAGPGLAGRADQLRHAPAPATRPV